MNSKILSITICLACILFKISPSFGQLTGIKNIPGDYATISSAVTAINTAGVGAGGVTFNVAANYTETITATISLTATGTAANPIIFQKDPAATGSNPLITAYTNGVGTPATAVQDGIWRLSGSDYVTINGIDVKDNPANTTNPSTMEYGYALYKASASNGCQFVTIENCTITLSNINNASPTNPMTEGSAGIIIMNATALGANIVLAPTAGGTNSGNKFYSNIIQNCNYGISMIGATVASPFTLADTNNDIGGNSLATGNTIINYGGASGATNPAAAIRTLSQYGLNVSNNTINNNNGSNTNHPTTLRGIYLNGGISANATITNNTITLNGGGTTQSVSGIENTSGSTAAANTINISNNSIINSTYTTAITGAFYGINNSATPAILTINSNTVSNNSSAATTTGAFFGIYNIGIASTVTINSNTISGNSTGALTTGAFDGIFNSASTTVLTINGNTLAGNSTPALSGVYYPISNSGTVTATININANNIGTGTSPAINFTAANSGSQVFINNTKGGAASALSISNNNFYNVFYSTPGTGSNTFVSNTAATLSQTISNNTFTNLNVNTTGSITFISNGVIVPANGTQNVNNNAISGTFTKVGIGGTVTLFTSAAASASGSVINNNSNNFSNITVSGTTAIAGWVNTDAGSSTKTIQNNTFSNWTAGTGAVNGMNINLTGINNATTGNAINNISGGGNVTGITTAAGNDKIYSNTINTLSSTGALAVTGILVTGGTNKNIYSNKIYDLQVNNAGGTVCGISVTGTTLVNANIYNNLIGDVRSPIANTSTDVVRGISLTATAGNSTINVYYNTIYLNAVSTGTNFSSSGIYHTISTIATTSALNLRNNSISNMSTPNGTGLTVAYRRSSATLTNYASTSNNNLFYAGATGANRLIFYDGTNSDQTLAAYKTLVSPRDALSVTEDLVTSSKFLSTSGSSASFLHLDPTKATQAESGAVNISGITTDFDGQTRQGNAGYAGTATAPDIGADEMAGTSSPALSGTYNVGAGQTFTSLTNAGGLFAGINSLGLKGNVVVNITSDLTEDGSNVLNQWAEQGIGGYALVIEPDASTLRTISGNVSLGMIRLNTAKRVTIDGSNGTTNNYLTFRNTNTAGATGTAFTFINGATNNTVKYCNVEAFANATNGVILFSTSTVAGGNSNNLISNCNINATVNGNTGNVCIYSAGTTGNENSTNTISTNNIFNYRDRALDIAVTGSKGWTINNNSFYNGAVTAAINYAASFILHGIRVLGGGGYSILNNYIGGSASFASGSNAPYSSTLGNLAFYGIQVTSTTGSATSNIKGNIIRGITISSAPAAANANEFVGIETIGAGTINVGGIAAGDGNTIGSNTSNGSVIINTNTTVVTYTSFIRGINYTSVGGLIIGNQIGGFDISNLGSTTATAAPSTFQGIIVNIASAPTQVNNNIMGSAGTGAAPNSIRVLSGSTANGTSLTGLNLSSLVNSTVQVNANIIQNMSQQVTTVTSGTFYGIWINAVAGANITVANNSIKSNSVASTTAAFYGILNSANPTSITISGDTISNNTSTAGTTGLMYGINTAGTGTSPISITNNTFAGNTTGVLTGVFAGIYNTAPLSSLTITSNAFYSNSTTSVLGSYYAIYNSGIVTTAININSNTIGTSTLSGITFNAANSGTQYFINNTGGAATTNLSISNNNFQNINYAVAGTGVDYFILNSAPTLSQAINGNTFTNLNVNTSGAVTFISDNVAVAATGMQNVNNNSIAGTFTKKVGGTLTLFTNGTNSAAGSVINNNSNNFSNITVTGATIIAGWVNTDAGNSNKNIQNNIFTNWVGGTSSITAMSVNLTGSSNATSGNIINNISGAAAITGILTGAGNDNIYSNTINTLSTTGAAAVTGISLTPGGNIKNIYKNKIYDLSGSNILSTVNGILVNGDTTVNIFNNLIGDLRTAIASAPDPIRGISITSSVAPSTINVYYNTIYLNATSTGANFGTTGIYHTFSAIATTATLNLRNNSITNTSSIKGTGYTVAFRRSGVALNNYASASNNNLFFAGALGAGKYIYWDGATGDLNLASYKSRVSPKDALSVTEDLTAKYLSVSGSSPVFLHMNSAVATAVESGGVNITGYTDDFDGQIRAGNPGYTGSSSSPDIGADEIFGVETISPTITYTLLTNTTSTTNRSVTGVAITDASGVNSAPGTKPRIYYKRFSDANVWLDNSSSTNGWKYTEATNSTSPFTFTIDYSLLYGGATVTAGAIQYFIVAQDIATTANIAINSGTFNAAPSSVALTSGTFPIGGTISNYTISFAGTYNVGAAEVFTSLTKVNGLFAAINSAGLAGNVVFNITSDLAEDGTNALNQWTESGVGNYTLTIQPDVATGRAISGNVVAGLIRLNGARRVTIDGRNSGSGSYLSFKNTNVAGTTGTAFTFINGATNNTIKYCDAEAFANATNGVILFGTSTIAGGNSNNVIDNCTINATVASNTGNVAVYSAGTTGNENSSDTISNNIVYGYRDRGLDVSATGSTAWTISGNSFYNGNVSGTINYVASSTLHGIRVLGGSGYSLLNNFIGGNGALASGTNAVYSSTLGNLSYQGILLTTSNASPASNIKGNTIAAISLSSVPTAPNLNAFIGIETNGSAINIGGSLSTDGNIIGSGVTNGSIAVTTSTASLANTTNIIGINGLSSGGVINNNDVGGLDISNIGALPAPSLVQGIYVNNAVAPTQINNNLIGNVSLSGSIRVLPASTAVSTSLTGIVIGTAINSAVQVNSNGVENISNLSTTSSGSFTGINNLATLSGAVVTMNADTIQYINTAANSNAGSTIYSGIVSSSAATISNNLISNISMSSTGTNGQITGVNIFGSYASTVSGNIISNFSTVSNKSSANIETGSPANSAIIGILNSTTAAGQIINNNRFSGFSATSNAGVNVIVTGIGITSTGSGNIFNNRFGTMVNLATGAAPGLCHIVATGGSFNVYNNVLRISNLTNTNSLKVYGIVHASTTAWNYFHNTIRIGGSSPGTALRSAAFLLSVNSSPVLKDNIFFNIRTGTGFNYAVSNLGSPPSNWPSTVSDFNDFYSINPNTVAEWGSGVGKTFAQWKSLTGGDAHSISNSISFIPSTFDLEPDSISNCAFDNAGTPITTPVVINTDINNKSRSTISPDLGAYEFSYVGFTVIASNNSPVCSGDSISLSVNPKNALSPHFSWRNPANTVVSTLQNPTLAITTTGQYKVTVTDSTGCFATDSTLVSVNQRPTAHISSVSQVSVCDSGYINLKISVTGTGTITGILSNGDTLSGTAPLLIDTVLVSATTSFSIISLSDSTCNSIPSDIPDTVTVTVSHFGDWLGITTNWHDAVNWCGGIVPTSSTDVNIPAGTPKMPLITDSVYCNSLIINSGDSLTLTGPGTLNIAGILTNSGTYTDNGTTNFNGTSGQQTFSGVTTFNNLKLNNTNGLLLPAAIVVKNNLTISTGVLNANNFNISVAGNWTNNASAIALTGAATFNGTTSQVIGGTFATTFTNLTITATGSTVTLNVNANILGNLSVSAGTFDLTGFTANRTAAGGILTVSGGATLKIGGTNTYPNNYTINTLVVTSTVEYSGTNQTVANQIYGNLKLSSSGGAAIKTFPATALTVVGNLTSTLGLGSSVSFTAGSNITVNGNVSVGASTTFNSGSYSHTVAGSWVNNGTFNGNTGTITFTGSGASVSGTGVQNFNNLTIAASGVTFSTNSITLSGNLATTGSGAFTQASGGTLIMNGIGTTISGSGISLDNLTISGSVSTSNSLNLTGNLAVSGSIAGSRTITMSGTSKTISGTGSIGFSLLNVTGSVTTIANFSISSSLTVSGSLSASAGTVTFTGTSTLSGTANLFNVTINGTSLQLSSGSVLGIGNIFTITSGTFDVTTFSPNTVNFNGTSAQNINAITYSNLILSNGNTKTTVGPITINNDITIGTGTTFNPSTYTHSIYGNWINNGTFTNGTSTIQFLGPSTSYITGATTFNILTSNTTSASTQIILQNNISASIVNMTSGTILTGANTLTITNTRTGNGIILGNIQRTHAFATGIAYAFEGPNNTITFSSVSSVTSVTVSIIEGSISDFPFGGSISRVYNIAVPSGTYNATLRLHYEDDELNGNNESSMALWHYNGSVWSSAGKTANSTTSNYVEHSGLTDITNRWTLSDNSNLVQWNGSVSTDWNTAANWTVLQGSGSRPPSSTDIVDLGTATFTNQPTINNSVTVKNIVFGSVQAVTLTLGSTGTLTTLGNINGNWSGNSTHTINVNNQSLTVNGDINLSDGTNGHAINLIVGSGSVTTLGSLSQSGGANINFSASGALNIYQDFNYSSGTFIPGSSTVTYNGNQNQGVANINYNNLAINKGGGLASINNPVNIAGNLLISSGELDNFSTTTISGNVTINATDTLQNYQVLHVHGNWNNNGIFIGNSSSEFFDGSGAQTITSTTFNNFIINKPVGSSATLSGNVLINGDLTVTSGTLDIQAFICNRSIQGGNQTVSDSGTLIIGAANAPTKFSAYSFANSSTVIYNGTAAQTIRLSGTGLGFGNFILRNASAKTLNSAITVNGNLTIESGSNFDAGSQTVTLNGNWINNGTFTPSTSTFILSGTGKTVLGNTTFNKVTIPGSYTNLSNITYNDLLHITSSGSISSSTGIFTTLNGDLINNGVLYTLGTTTFTGNVLQTLSLINAVTTVALIVNFNGTVSPVLNSTSTPQYGYLNINNTGGVNPSVDWTILYSLTVGSGASFNCGVTTQNMYGSVTNNGAITSSGILNFIPATAATVNLGTNFLSAGRAIFGGAGAMTIAGASPLSFHNVVISNTNSIGVAPSSAWRMSNNFTVNNGSIFNAGNYVDSVGGKISNSGTINSGTSTFVLNGSGAQDIFTLSNFNNLTIKKALGVTTTSSNVTVNGILNFITGNIQTGSNAVIQPSTGTVTGTAQNTGWINGNLQKSIATGSNVPRAFEIGDSTYYTPATILFANVSVGGNLTASTTPGEHPQVDLSGINKNLDINRYWTLTNTGIGFTTAASTLNWVPSDVDAGATTANFKVSVYNGSTWGFSKVATPLPTSIQATGLTSLGTFVVGEGPKITTWTGAAGTPDWFASGNWFGGVPNATIESLIPATLQAGRFFPVINTGIATIDTVTIQSTATLALTNSTLQIKGAVINNGIFDASNGTIEMTGATGQTISANTFANNSVNNLIVSNSSTAGVTLGGALDLYGSLTYSGSGMTLATNDLLTLKSTALKTASVGDMTSNTITGKVTVERYISAHKAWRLLSVPTNTTQSIKQAWQEGCGTNLDCVAGYGTQITGPGGVPAGFDVYTGTPSMKTYVSLNNTWSGVPNTASGIKNTGGYIIFIRGDRSSNSFASPVTATVLRTKGNLYTGDQTAVPVLTGKFASIGNPYASAVDMRNIVRTGLKDFFYVWDPNLGGSSGFGGYQTFSYSGANYVVTPGLGSYGAPGSVSNNLQSGQAFLVQADSSGNSSLTFKEAAKTSGSGQISRPSGLPQPQLRTGLFGVNADNSTYMIDGTLSNYEDSYSNNVDDMDAIKSPNTAENLSIKTGDKLLVIERRHTIVQQDTIFLNLTGTKAQKYRFQFTADQLGGAGLTGFLEDTYLHTSTALDLNGSTIVDFNIVNIAGCYAPARFRIVFRQLTELPVTFTSIKAYQQNKDIAVEWKVDNETNMKQYDVEKSSDGNNYSIAGTVSANNIALSNYRWLDVQPGAGYNYYRLLTTDKDGKAAYSTVVKVFIGKGVQSISIYPNPVEKNGTINLQLTNQPAGTYGLRLVNKLGQVMISKQINHVAGSSTETLQMDRYSAHGIYQLEVTKPDGNTMNIEVIH